MNTMYTTRFIRFMVPRFFTAGTFGVDGNGCKNFVHTGGSVIPLSRKAEMSPPLSV